MHKLTDKQINEILYYYKNGISACKIARKYGVSDCWIWRLAKKNNINKNI